MNFKIKGEEEETYEERVLSLLVARLEQVEQTQLQIARELAALRSEMKPDAVAVRQQDVAHKKVSVDAMQATIAQLHKQLEQNPQDPAVVAAIIDEGKKSAAIHKAQKRARFIEAVRNARRREVYNNTGQAHELRINDLPWIVKPGRNVLPEPYAALWDDITAADDEAQLRARAVAGMRPYLVVQDWVAGGRT